MEHFKEFGAKEHVRRCRHLYILVDMFVLAIVLMAVVITLSLIQHTMVLKHLCLSVY